MSSQVPGDDVNDSAIGPLFEQTLWKLCNNKSPHKTLDTSSTLTKSESKTEVFVQQHIFFWQKNKLFKKFVILTMPKITSV